MNLADVQKYVRPKDEQEARQWEEGNSFVAGGTWLYSEPQPKVKTIIDLMALKWPCLEQNGKELSIAATCRIQDLLAFESPPEWKSAHLFKRCAEALSASFKIFNSATIGGNICMSLPAGSMISLATALQAEYEIWPNGDGPKRVDALDFHTGEGTNILQAGDILRSIHIPDQALRREALIDYRALTPVGRSAALIIVTYCEQSKQYDFNISASTTKPYRLSFNSIPKTNELEQSIKAHIPENEYFNDLHGDPFYRKEMTFYLCERLRKQL